MSAGTFTEKYPETNRALQMLEDYKYIHLWHQSDHAVCGAVLPGHDCRGLKGNFVIVNFAVEETCPGCGKPLCPYCKLLAVS